MKHFDMRIGNMFIVYISVEDLKYKNVLPENDDKEDRHLKFYELCVKCGNVVVARLPFGRSDKTVWLTLAHRDENPSEYKRYRLFKYGGDSLKFSFFINKITEIEMLNVKYTSAKFDVNEQSQDLDSVTSDLIRLDMRRLCFIRHLAENNMVGVIPFCEVDFSIVKEASHWVKTHGVSVKYVRWSHIQYPIKSMNVARFFGETWNVNRQFYQESHLHVSDFSAKEMYQMLAQLVYRWGATSITSITLLLDRFHSVLGRRVVYDNDRTFNNTKKITDHNDERVLLTGMGDCEDFMHYYLRGFQTMKDTFRFFLSSSDPCYTVIDEFFSSYHPMGFICRINNSPESSNTAYEFHATILIVPTKASEQRSSIIFEVTSNRFHAKFSDKNSDLYNRYVMFHALIDRHYCMIFKDFKARVLHELYLDEIKNEFKPL